MKLLLWCFCYYIGLTSSFLLDTSTKSTMVGQKSPLTDQHFVTVIELLSEEKRIRRQLEQSLTLLQQEVQSLKTQMNTNLKHDGACDQLTILDLKQQIFELKENNKNLSAKVESLTIRQAMLKNEFDVQTNSFRAQTNELNILKNMTDKLKSQVSDLKSLKSINQLQTVKTLENEINSLTSKTNTILGHEAARQQDLVALYNQITTSDEKIQNLKNQTDRLKNQTLSQMQELRTDFMTNLTLKYSYIESEMQTRFESLNATSGKLQQEVNDNDRKVGITTCGADISGNVIKFPTVRESVGVTDIASFKSSGKFTCEYSGLYHISVTIMSSDSNRNFYIKRNNDSLVGGYVTRHDLDQGYHTSTINTVAVLTVNDVIWVDKGSTGYIYPFYSCFTIIKVQ